MAVTFESMERRMPKIEKCLAEYGIASLEEARELCNSKGFDPYDIVKCVQPIAFENAGWAYTLGCAVAIKKGVKTALDENDEVIGYQFVNLGKMMQDIRHGVTPDEAYKNNIGQYGRFDNAAKYIDPREE